MRESSKHVNVQQHLIVFLFVEKVLFLTAPNTDTSSNKKKALERGVKSRLKGGHNEETTAM